MSNPKGRPVGSVESPYRAYELDFAAELRQKKRIRELLDKQLTLIEEKISSKNTTVKEQLEIAAALNELSKGKSESIKTGARHLLEGEEHTKDGATAEDVLREFTGERKR